MSRNADSFGPVLVCSRISPNWNTIALEYLSDRMRFTTSVQSATLVLRYYHYFGLRKMDELEGLEVTTMWLTSKSDDRLARLFRRASMIEVLELIMERTLLSELGSLSHRIGTVPVRNLIIDT
ncbi:hypothetical protein PRIPAC_88409 [Pristionchus pacificus]|uniref:Uncharacterized protein n=1 Tax=Pristionchus pacificus TaxID=54126 RepID=A0A2A6B9A9_PRIPA|nr:hypothetical protein PRIPAC_88409 [Pristionchus pacificus]|eukprot:PDM62458.1 hypothetical protein PRIPAC_51900 [Pristionchus pacificus]